MKKIICTAILSIIACALITAIFYMAGGPIINVHPVAKFAYVALCIAGILCCYDLVNEHIKQ